MITTFSDSDAPSAADDEFGRQHWYALARHTPLGILCDLDGTLLPLTASPIDSHCPPELIALLAALNELPGLRLVIVSGRQRKQLESLLAGVPDLWLVAEHGAWQRRGAAWESSAGLSAGDIEPLHEQLQRVASRFRGALVERKSWSVTIHYRQVSDLDSPAMLVEVDAIVDEWLAGMPGFERLDGAEVVEVRPRRIRKSLAVPWLRDELTAGSRLLVLGDDLTDEDMFREIGAADESVLVGAPRRSHARWQLDDPAATAGFLTWLAAVRSGEQTPAAKLAEWPLPRRLLTRSRAPVDGRERFDLLVISNRLPSIRPVSPSEPNRRRNVGGMVAALEPALRTRRGLWLGWSGHTISDDDDDAPDIGFDETLEPPRAWIDYPERWHRLFYNGFSNRALWPLFHSFPMNVTFADKEWETYREVNQAFADVAGELVSPDVPVWVQDYHLLLTADALRERGHRGPLGLFLHIPFPAADLFRLLPWAGQLVDGMLDFDLLGFQTQNDVNNFRQTVAELSSARVGDDLVEHRGRRVQLGAFPIGIMPDMFHITDETAVVEEVDSLLRAIAPGRLVLGVDRLDYTKGIPERLAAFGHLLERYPEWRGQVSLVQISVPSRADVPEYKAQRTRIENIVGRINGEYGDAVWVPVRYLYRSYPPDQLAALYRAADVGYVTPLRDGMNLVAKEYVAAQDPDDPGVLLLSRFAGAAVELSAAVLTNPWHADGVARDLDRALRMGLDERRERHEQLLAAVLRTTAVDWAENFLETLTAIGGRGE
ncbi:MAG: trehalose-phosphatase [Candidatus Promineofilum sp.]|nr:trehalose-phosphatase [Promineifilum sp.]